MVIFADNRYAEIKRLLKPDNELTLLKFFANLIPVLAIWPGGFTPAAFGQWADLPKPVHITSDQGLPQAFNPAILQDRQGFIWMATLDGLCRYDGRNFKVFQPSSRGLSSISSAAVIGLKEDREGGIWIVTEKGTIDYFNPGNEAFENISQHASFQKAFPWKPYEVLYDSRKTLWIGFGGHGLGSFDRQGLKTRHFLHDPHQPASLGNNDVFGILEDRHGYIWIGTANGLDRLDPVSGRFRHYRHEEGNASSLPENNILGIYERQDGTMLVASGQYVSLFDPERGVIRSYRLQGTDKTVREPVVMQFATDLEGNDYFAQHGYLYRFHPATGVQMLTGNAASGILSVYIDRTNVLWLGTDGQGVYKFNLMAAGFRAEAYEKNFHTDLLSKHLGIAPPEMPQLSPATSPYYFRATNDKRGRTWFNTGFTPFYRWDPVIRRLDKIPFLFPIQSHEPAPPVPLATDPDGKIWALYDHTVAWYDEAAHTWIKFPFTLNLPRFTGDQTDYMRLLQFVVDERDLWIITNTHGLFRINRATGKISRYAHNPSDTSTLSSDALFCIFADPEDSDILWIGTFGNGLCRFDKTTGRSQRFTDEDGLPNNVVYAAIPDAGDYLWLATNKGVCRFHRKTFETKTYTRADGLQADEFNRFHFLHLPDDRIVLGGLEGITAFYPGQVAEDAFEPRIEIISIQINNEPLPPDLLPGAVPVHQANHLELASDQNFITVGFAGMQFNNPGKMRFRYLLEGVNREWVTSGNPEAIYTNLSPGLYTLKLNASNTSGKWSPHVRILTFRIMPPWWAAWWAYILYVLGALALVYGAVRLYLKQREAVHLREIDELKTRFFTNITHEFRTPLTLILSPVQQLKKVAKAPSEWLKNEFRLELIERNARQLLQLVNQFLDLSRIEAGTMEIYRQLGDLTEFVRQLTDSFRDQAQGKNISLEFHSGLAEQRYWFDALKLESIVYNLVANAIKFTEEGGSVRVNLATAAGGVSLEVSDTGKGIPENKLPHIFDRFYQLDNTSTREHQGSGIGLALIRELTGLMGGHIRVKSKVNRGSAFTVFLPLEMAAKGDKALFQKRDYPEHQNGILKNPVPGDPAPETPAIVLLVEDNKELSDFIADCLPEGYRVEQAFNGQEGFETAIVLMPDIVISDVLMPVMDGFTLCRQLKTDLRTSHIPVILLTAKASQDSRMAGLSDGADHYLTKPFHPDELLLQVSNQLEQQRKYRTWLQSQFSALPGPTDEIAVESSDPFIGKIYELLEANLDSAAYDVNQLTTDLGMHRSTLFRKIKILTDLPPNDLIRSYRLKRAAQFLGKGAMISDAAYKVGFDNLSYFSKCFREQFGMTPTEYGKQRGEN